MENPTLIFFFWLFLYILYNFLSKSFIMLRLSAHHKGYLCPYHTGRIYITWHVNFNEKGYHFINDLKFNRTSQIRHIEVSNLMIQFYTITCQVDDLPAANNVSSQLRSNSDQFDLIQSDLNIFGSDSDWSSNLIG